MITLFIILWLLIGFISYSLHTNSWRVKWYKKFNEHYIDTNYFSFKEELFWFLIFTLGGVFTILVMLNYIFNPTSEYYFPNSLWMIFYNRKKVEKHFNKLKQNK
jgi:hypothetical protein